MRPASPSRAAFPCWNNRHSVAWRAADAAHAGGSSANEYRVTGAPRSPEPSRASMKTSSAALDADDSSEVTGVFRIAGDVRPVEALFRNTVEQAPVGIAFANRDGSFRHCNRAFCSMLGFDAAELNNRPTPNHPHGEHLAATTAGLERLWGGELAHLDVEKRYVRKDGSALWVRVTTSLVRDGGAEPVCSVELLRDISASTAM